MYQTPRLQRYGTLRQLTQVGKSTGWDMVGILLDNDDVGCKGDGKGGVGNMCRDYDRS